MDDLESRLAEDVRLRGMSEGTLKRYLEAVAAFKAFLNGKTIEEAGEEDLRAYSRYLREDCGLQESTINSYLAAIIFAYEVTLGHTLNRRAIPYMKKPKKLPAILTREEIARLIGAADGIRSKTFLSLGYGSGLRASEVAALHVRDIDSEAMRITVRSGKGKKDRCTVLASSTLALLREYWAVYRPDAGAGVLFSSRATSGHVDPKCVSSAFARAAAAAGIEAREEYRFHTLRHCFATHLLEQGASLVVVKELMGHSSLRSTLVYVHLAAPTSGISSPADALGGGESPW